MSSMKSAQLELWGPMIYTDRKHYIFLSCLLHYYRGVAKGEMGEEGMCLLSFMPPILLQRSSKGRNGPVSSFFPASYIITEE